MHCRRYWRWFFSSFFYPCFCDDDHNYHDEDGGGGGDDHDQNENDAAEDFLLLLLQLTGPWKPAKGNLTLGVIEMWPLTLRSPWTWPIKIPNCVALRCVRRARVVALSATIARHVRVVSIVTTWSPWPHLKQMTARGSLTTKVRINSLFVVL